MGRIWRRIGSTAVGVALWLGAAAAGAAQDGKQIFLAQKCQRCHAVADQGIERDAKAKKARGSDLSAVGGQRDADWLRRYLRRRIQLEGEDHAVAWKGSDAELETLVDWLTTLRTP